MSDRGEGERERAWALLRRCVGEAKPEWTASMLEHARIVETVALFLAGLWPPEAAVDSETLALGAILHDVGRTRARRIVEHGIRSGEIIREQGFPEAVARIGETHVGVGITAAEAVELGLPAGDYVPRSPEERIVCYADNLLFYLPEEDRHEIRDTPAVVQRFTRQLGKAYGERARIFMTAVERELGSRGRGRFRAFVSDRNRELARSRGGEKT